ncbi:TIGR00730 family Rossman fold protein [Sphingomonas sp. BIUV-7]|uniref:Cytokinin riboside 5'-monophosphate phosphoribohydrolase n=1 Tax=Sphingomonas natans TaxID=3063330 RepID=A0ABT8YEF6_9SPHN|nr:TIGR00730 family Rossman fold protein [Sphingomonas sp. BIUV-7]MDO6415965.1 TIGR00730 family Rossman fold protein [Sphingomonas sp. BIUV-7]
MKRLAIYCGSATPADPRFIDNARDVGRTLAERGIGVVYGGGRLGLMGAIADSALAAGGAVIGVIPKALVDAEVAHRGLTELHVVETMHERKQAFTDLSDGFVTLPGGTGTMDELWEALSWAQIGYHAKPVGLLNVAGFYDGLLSFVATMAEAGFLRPQHRDILIASDSLDDLLGKMAAHVPLRTITQMKAAEL